MAKSHRKLVAQINSSNNKTIKIWSSLKEAGKFCNVSSTYIIKATKTKIKIKGFIWRKVDKKTGEIIEPTN